MPIPFLLAGLGVAAGVIGAGGHLSAKETNEQAQRIASDAQKMYNDAKCSLEQAKNKTEEKLLKLGYAKKNTLDSSMRQFLSSYDKIKHIQITESIGINEISKFSIGQQDAIELRQMTDIYSSSIKSGAAGAAAGTVIALAASGSLSIVTGGLMTAGTALVAGEVGMAAGIAGSALSFGAAVTPLAAVAAPVILFTGISASMKADENLEKANVMYAEAEAAAEKMKVSETFCDAITERSEMFNDLLLDLNEMFAECSSLLAGVIKKKEGRIFKKKLSSQDFSEEDMKLIAITRALAGAVKSVIDTPILSKDGEIYYESDEIYDQTRERLPDFNQAIEEVKMIDYNVKPIEVKVIGAANTNSDTSSTTVLGSARRIFALVLGFIIATVFAENLALGITDIQCKFLFFKSITVNKIAIWLLICTSIMMITDGFNGTKIRKWCGIGSGIGLFILYVQYCRSVELMKHYIFFSVIVFFVCCIFVNFFDKKREGWSCGSYFHNMGITLAFYPLLFLIYAFFSKFVRFSNVFCLVTTSIIMFLISLGVMSVMDE